MDQRIKQLEEQIAELQSNRAYFSTYLSSLLNNYSNNNKPYDYGKADKLKQQIKEIEIKLTPLIEEYEKNFYKYIVTFSSEIPNTLGTYKSRVSFPFIKMLSTIDCNIDSEKDGFNDDIANLRELIWDLGSRLTQGYTNLRFDYIKKIQ